MVRGLERFKVHFRDYADCYILIGGTACSLALEEVGLDFRVTKDLDIVLCVEALDHYFVETFWDFIRAGGYRNQQKSTGRKLFYRFHDPEDATYPVMLELFSRKPDALAIRDESHLTPITVDEEVSSLSAILLDDDYYHFIHAGKHELGGVSVVGEEYLIPLKAKAWLDMIEREKAGEKVDSKDIKKHKNDVFRLFQIISPDISLTVPESIKEDLQQFFSTIEAKQSVDLEALGIKTASLDEVCASLRKIYGL